MATEVPFHSTFGNGYLSEAEAEARTAICTKLSLEQLDKEPYFRARLFWIRVRKFVADRFASDDDIEIEPRQKGSSKTYFALVCLLLLGLYCGLSPFKLPLDNAVVTVRNSLLANLGSQPSVEQSAKNAARIGVPADLRDLPQVSPAPLVPPAAPVSQPGWCHIAKLWAVQPTCGPMDGVWDSAPVRVARAARPAGAVQHDAPSSSIPDKQQPEVEALDNKVQMAVEMLHSAFSQQDKVNALLYHLLSDVKTELINTRVQPANGLPAGDILSPQAAPATAQYAAIAVCAVLLLGGAMHLHSQNRALRASQNLILAQLAEAKANTAEARKAAEDMQRVQRRMERINDEARADSLQMHESLRGSLQEVEQRFGRLDSVEGAIGTLGASVGAVSVEVLSWANEGRTELAECQELLGSMRKEQEHLLAALGERDAMLDQQAERIEELSREVQEHGAQVSRLNTGMENSVRLQHQLQDALLAVEEELAEREAEMKRAAAAALDIEQALAASQGFCELLRGENEKLESALEKTQAWVAEDEGLRNALDAELEALKAAHADLQQRLATAEEQARSAVAEADKQRKASIEKDKLLHYKKYELEMMAKAVQQLQQQAGGEQLPTMASAPAVSP